MRTLGYVLFFVFMGAAGVLLVGMGIGPPNFGCPASAFTWFVATLVCWSLAVLFFPTPLLKIPSPPTIGERIYNSLKNNPSAWVSDSSSTLSHRDNSALKVSVLCGETTLHYGPFSFDKVLTRAENQKIYVLVKTRLDQHRLAPLRRAVERL